MRLDAFRYRTMFSYIGRLISGVSLTLLIPLFALVMDFSVIHFWGFLLPALVSGAIGWIMWHRWQPDVDALSRQEAAVVVSLTWLFAIFVGAAPLALTRSLGVLDALYEAVSGWTGAGLTMVVQVESLHPTVKLWRSLMQYVGGAGFAVLALSAVIGPRAAGLYEAEARTDHLLPSLLDTAKVFLQLYVGLLAFGVISYMAVGMSFFDALNHAMTALASGGSSTYSASIGHFDSLGVEVVTSMLSLLGTISFVSHFRAISSRSLRPYRDDEAMGYLLLIGVLSALVWYAIRGLFSGLMGLRVAFFHVVTGMSTTGFMTVDLSNWSDLGKACLALAMMLGGSTGSSAGGMKLYRVAVIWRLIWWTFRSRYHPERAVPRRAMWRHGSIEMVSHEEIIDVTAVLAMYLLFFVLGVGAFMAYGYSLADSCLEYVSALSTVGLSVGITGPDMPVVLKLAQMFAMWLGRLEFIVVLVMFAKLRHDLTLK